jgi:uncharacterized Zn finger protein
MADTEAVLVPLSCPGCGHDGARVQVASATVLTVRCPECDHIWSVDSTMLPSAVRERVTEATAPPHR